MLYKFADVLKDLIEDKGLSLRKLATESGVSAVQYGKYLKGVYPKIFVAERIARYFNVSFDYLFGITENNPPRDYKDVDMSVFLDRYEEARFHSTIHRGTKLILTKHNVPFTDHIAKQITPDDYENFDYIICMEEYNIRNMQHIIGRDSQNKVHRLLDFTPTPKDVDDPWYHHNFDKTYEEILLGCQYLLSILKQQIQ